MQDIALAVMRLQPLHRGHEMLIGRMLKECDQAIVAIGSIQAHDARNPYSFEQRRAMVEACFNDASDRLDLIGLRDIGAPDTRSWAAYVLGTIAQAGLKRPTHYYAGSEDAHWFEGVLPVRRLDRFSEGAGISATAIRADLKAGRSVEDRIPKAVLELIQRWQHGV